MDSLKKRKLGENGVVSSATNGGVGDYHLHNSPSLSPQDSRKIIERFTVDQLLDILQDAVARHVDVLDAVRSIADADISQRKLFVRGLGWDTTTDGLRSLFSSYGELEEAVVILDKTTGRSKGYGFVTFRHVDGALLALKEPSKKIDGRMTVTQLAAAGNSAPNSAANTAAVAAAASASSADVSQRKIYVANVPYDMASDKLLAHFSMYGAIEEGPLGFDKQTGKCRGYAFFVYKFPEGAQAALVQPVKTIEGRQLNCKLAVEGKKGKEASGAAKDGVQAPGAAGGPVNALPASIPGQFGGTGGIGPYTGFLGGPRLPPMGHHHGLNSSIGGPPGLGSAGGYGAGLSGPYGEYGGLNSAGYGGGAGGGMAGPGGGLSGTGAGGGSALYPEGGHYGLSSSSAAYPGQHHQQPGTSSVTRVPPGGMYPPPYY